MIEIRKATQSDIPFLATLLGHLFEQEKEFTANLEKQTKGLEMIISDPAIGELIVAEREGEPIIGMVSLLYTVSTAMGGRVALMEDMVIHPDYRNQGYGSVLVGAAVELAKTHDCKRITLLTDFDDLAAERFYQKHGFSLSPMVPLRQILE
jgi:N-acetylglutamate synthase-like GNAT family acetyltransferase